jgi:Na+/H+ antiporter NhaD/arsenite permease-like protein
MKTWPGGLPVNKLGDLTAMFSSENGRGDFICFLFVVFWSDWSACASLFFIYILFFKSCLMVPKLRLTTQSKKAERGKAENQYFLYSTLIRRAMVEANCPTLACFVSGFAVSHSNKSRQVILNGFLFKDLLFTSLEILKLYLFSDSPEG